MYRNMLLSQPYSNKLVALVVYEAHCEKLWGEKFRKVFGEIGDLRSLVSRSVNVMALTATATAETLSTVTKRLFMNKTNQVSENTGVHSKFRNCEAIYGYLEKVGSIHY